jgi:hypothetical protein
MIKAMIKDQSRAMLLGRVLLYLFGVGFMLLGVRYFADPRALTGESDLVLPNAKAMMEIRTVYGGMFAGLGLTLAVLSLRASDVPTGLRVLIMVAGLVAAARIGGIALGQAPDTLFAAMLGIEIVGIVLAVIALHGIGKAS